MVVWVVVVVCVCVLCVCVCVCVCPRNTTKGGKTPGCVRALARVCKCALWCARVRAREGTPP